MDTEKPVALVAEDSAKVRAQLVGLLHSLGVTAIEASGGLEALKLATEHRPRLILLDGLLPEMHGFEIARHIRQLDADYHPRIVIITAVYKQTQYQNEARLKYGIDDYLIKPVTVDSLRGILERMRSSSYA
ncbi:MAG TPA: response regulator [Thermoanaerobaculia bacterium]|nr:response regulator [Thermoanaerobaculia bacterium]